MRGLLALLAVAAFAQGPLPSPIISGGPGGSGGSGTVTSVACAGVTITTSGTCAPITGATPGALVVSPTGTTLGNPSLGTGPLLSTAGVPSIAVGGVSGIPSANIIAHWDFHEGTGTTASDISGHSFTLNLASGSNAPTWITGGGLSFNGANFQYLYDAAQSFNTNSTVTACALVDTSSVGPSVNGYVQQIIVGSSGSNGWNFATTSGGQSSTNWMPSTALGGSTETSAYDTAYGRFQLCVVRGVSSDTIYINGQLASNYASHSGSLTGTSNGVLTVGSNPGNGQGGGLLPLAGNYAVFNGAMYDIVLYSTAQTAAQIQQIYQGVLNYQTQSRGLSFVPSNLNPATTNNFLCVGDSLTAGTNSSVAGGYCASSRLTPTQSFVLTNLGIGGLTTTQMSDMSFKSAGSQNQYYYLTPRAGWNIASIWGGTNDLCNGVGATPAQVVTNLLSIASYVRGLGWIPYISTMISRGGLGTGGGSCDSVKDVFNALLRTQVPPLYTLVDIASIAVLGADGAYANTTYYSSDQTHLTDTGYILVANYEIATINATTQSAGLKGIHVGGTSSTPTVAAGGAISTTPTISGNDFSGTVSVPSSAVTIGTIATVTFYAPYFTAPKCTVTQNGGLVSIGVGHGTPGTTTFTITSSVANASAAAYNFDYVITGN